MLNLVSLKHLMKPIIRLCLNSSGAVKGIYEVIKVCLVECAIEELENNGHKINVSRVSAITGLQRRDVQRLLESTDDSLKEATESLSLVGRVINQWENDKRFQTKSGKSKILSIEGDNSDLKKLVSLISTDIHQGTVLYELKRLGKVAETPNGIKLLEKTEDLRDDPQRAYELLSLEVSDLISAVDQNIQEDEEIPLLQARTFYDNVFVEDLPQIREWILKEGSEFHRKVRNYIGKYDKDLNPHIRKEAGGKVSVSAFSFITKGDGEDE